MHKHTNTHSLAHTHTHTHTLTCTHLHTHTHTHPSTQKHTCIHTQIHARTQTLIDTCTRTHARAHTYAHTHKLMIHIHTLSLSLSLFHVTHTHTLSYKILFSLPPFLTMSFCLRVLVCTCCSYIFLLISKLFPFTWRLHTLRASNLFFFWAINPCNCRPPSHLLHRHRDSRQVEFLEPLAEWIAWHKK